MQNQWVVFTYLCTDVHMCVIIIIMERESISWELQEDMKGDTEREAWSGLHGGKGREESTVIIFKLKKIKFN